MAQTWQQYQRAQTQKAESGISAIEDGSPIVRAQMNALVDLKPDELDEESIYRQINNGLGTRHAPGLVDRLKRNQKQRNPTDKIFLQTLSAMWTAGTFGKKKNASTAEIYIRLQKNLDTFLKTNPSSAEAQKFFEQLIVEDVRTFGFLNSNSLPGWDDNPLEVTIGERGAQREIEIRFGDIVVIEGIAQQAVSRKDGQIEWLPVKPQ